MPNKRSSNNVETIIRYWLGSSDSNPAKFKTQQKLWYHSKPETDNYIRTAFESDLASAENSDLSHWRNTAEGSLALVILLDQFSRNLYRGTPAVYANDVQAQDVVVSLLERDGHLGFNIPALIIFFTLSIMLKTLSCNGKLFPCSKRCLNMHRVNGGNPSRETLRLSKTTAISSASSVDSPTATLFWAGNRHRKSVSTYSRINVLMDSNNGFLGRERT